MPAECVLIQAPLEPADVVRVSQQVDCIVNSANNNLLTPGVSGIAGALLAAGGPELLEASNAAKRDAGGEVAIGSAVATDGGQLPCGVVHAVAMGYRPRGTAERERLGRRVLATAASVEEALRSALLVAAERGWRSAASKILCARPGYSTYIAEEAPLIMLAAMRRAVSTLPSDCAFETLQIYVPLETLELVGVPPYLEPKESLNAPPPAAEVAGNSLCHCFEVVRDDGDSDAVDDGDGSGELLATGRIWCAQGGSNGQSADAGAGAAKI